MSVPKNTSLEKILWSLFQTYQEMVPEVKEITHAMLEKEIILHESEIINDHIAFRTLGVPNLGIQSFEKIFLHYGYKKMDSYFFDKKKLNAHWYAPPEDSLPRIFISELKVLDLSEESQEIINHYTQHITSDPVDAIDLDNITQVSNFFTTPLWELPTVEDYTTLQGESEYASWVIYNRYYLNHYTISVHELRGGYNHIEAFNKFLESIGIVLNSAGGKIKTSTDGLLKQSSTVANTLEATFAKGEKMKISTSYVEFAERQVLSKYAHLQKEEIMRHHRRDGFETSNADKIFESTYTTQTKKIK